MHCSTGLQTCRLSIHGSDWAAIGKISYDRANERIQTLMDCVQAYELHAHEFLQGLDKSNIGTSALERWVHSLRSGATVIELGCGGGYPIKRVLDSSGLQLWAVDSSATLIAKLQSRFPAVPVQCTKVQENTFFNQAYDRAIAIGLVFLLPESEQSEVICNIARILHPGGRFLFTAPIEKGNWVDLNTGLKCRSLGQEVYEDQIRFAGLRTVATYTDSGGNNYHD